MPITETLTVGAKRLGAWIPDALMAGGAAAVAFGAGFVYPPLTWLVGGAFTLAAGVLLARGDR